jgi:SAM-dependent methyltransferase
LDRYLQSNLTLWNTWADMHVPSAYYDVKGFKAGRSSLRAIEVEELGDVTRKSLLHLQCHFGMDTLSWARRGAAVTGADFSDHAIAAARALAAEVNLPARFIQSEVYRLPDVLEGQFDIVYTSYGVLFWLPDLRRWAEVIAHSLKPGGIFYIVEYHPFAAVFENENAGDLEVAYPYFHGPEPLEFETNGSYADRMADFHFPEYGWDHPLSEIINALLSVGLRLEFVHEFPYCGEQRFPFMVRGEDGWWRLAGKNDNMIPVLFSLKATKAS